MIAVKCDRCGGYYDYDRSNLEDNSIIVSYHDVIDNSWDKSRWVDLCPECMKKLQDWLTDDQTPKKHSLL